MIPTFSHIENYKDIPIWVTNEGKCGLAFEINSCDIESEIPEEYHKKLVNLIRNVDQSVLLRLSLYSGEHCSEIEGVKRAKAISEIGFFQNKLIMTLELDSEPVLIKAFKNLLKVQSKKNEAFEQLAKVHDQVKVSGFSTRQLSEAENEELFVTHQNQWRKCDASIHTGTSRIGILRLVKPANFEITENNFAMVLQTMPKPFKVHFSMKRLNPAKVKMDLERKLKQSLSDKTVNPINSNIQESTTEALTSALKDGSHFFEYELQVALERDSESELSNSLREAANILTSLGDFQVETFGAAPSFLATLPGNSQHVTLTEIDSVLPLLMPAWVLGESLRSQPLKSSLLLHRSDKSIFDFNLFNTSYSVYNSLIIGTSGKGKSVLTGLLTQSLLNDPDINVIKVDVGGSHSKECKLLGGKEFILELNRPSGINPFDIMYDTQISDSEKIAILSKFLTVLIREQDETVISKDLRSKIESSVQEYLKHAKAYKLQEFFDIQLSFPRRNLLQRWVKDGVYENAFASEKHNYSTDNRQLRYYNFSQIFQASDPEFAQAGLAAVLAQFNFEALVNNKKRIVLICDETPFFIKSCFEFFKFSTANVRKYGHAVVLVSQLSTDLVVDGDTGLIENSPQRFLFSVDGNVKAFQERFNLSEEKVSQIKNLKAMPGKFSEVLFQSVDTARKLRIQITPNEYWSLTSSKQDQDKLKHLQAAVPGLTLVEAIKCLSLV